MNLLQILQQSAPWQRAKEWLASCSRYAWSACVMVCASVVLHFLSEEWQNQQSQLQAESAMTMQRAAALQTALADKLAPADGLEAFQSRFPEVALREQRTVSLLVLLRRYGLVVKQTNLRQLAPSPLGLSGYAVALPLAGNYTAVRGFIDEAMRADPALALRSVKLQRKDALTDNLQAQLVFTLWMRQGGSQ